MIADTNTCPAADADTAPLFSAPYAPPDEAIAASLLDEAARASGAERRIDGYARRLVEGIRARAGGLGGIEDFLQCVLEPLGRKLAQDASLALQGDDVDRLQSEPIDRHPPVP